MGAPLRHGQMMVHHPDKIHTLDPRSIKTLLAVMARLRDPKNGCPWDIQQNYKSIARYTIEEAYEVADAIDRGQMADLKEELGDLLFQTVFYTQIAQEEGQFNFDDVVEAITEKMIRRHPHVFDQGDNRNAQEQTIAWEAMKAKERKAKGQGGLLDDVPMGLPGLSRAVKLQKRAARIGFDWPSAEQVLDKLNEETIELAEAMANQDHRHIEEEFGDLLFVLANLSRPLKVDPEHALRRANQKFTQRFSHVEHRYNDHQRQARSAYDKPSLDLMESWWQEAKQKE